MAIAFTCSCGKAMKAKEAFAGRKVRCPRCDNVVRIPPLEHGEEDLSATPPPDKAVATPSFEKSDRSGERPMLPTSKPVARPSFSQRGDGARSPLPPLAT